MKRLYTVIALLLLASMLLAACGSGATPAPTPAPAEAPTTAPEPTPPPPAPEPAATEAPEVLESRVREAKAGLDAAKSLADRLVELARELELRRATLEEAEAAIFGVTALGDITARDLQPGVEADFRTNSLQISLLTGAAPRRVRWRPRPPPDHKNKINNSDGFGRFIRRRTA